MTGSARLVDIFRIPYHVGGALLAYKSGCLVPQPVPEVCHTGRTGFDKSMPVVHYSHTQPVYPLRSL